MFNGHKMYSAGVGANMAYVVGQDMWLDAITVNHVPENPDEALRVTDNGAEIQRPPMEAKLCGMDCRGLNFGTDLVVTPGGELTSLSSFALR